MAYMLGIDVATNILASHFNARIHVGVRLVQALEMRSPEVGTGSCAWGCAVKGVLIGAEELPAVHE